MRGSAAEIAAQVAAVPYEEQPEIFFQLLRGSEIPYSALNYEGKAPENYEALFDAVYLLARANLPLTIALTMHLYVIHGIAHAPYERKHSFGRKAPRILKDFRKHNLLVAVSTLGSRVEADPENKPGIRLTSTEEGTLKGSGSTVFQSLAGQADLVAFAGLVDDTELCYFLAPLKHLKTGEAVFGGVMEHTDTRSLSWEGLELPRGAALLTGEEEVFDLFHYQTAWFQGLLSAAYLGAASALVEEARKVLREHPAADRDRRVVQVGRIVLRHRHALGMARSLGSHLKVKSFDAVEDLLDTSSVVKYHTAELVQSMAVETRRLLGPAGVRPGSLLNRLGEQLAYAQLQPMSPAAVELDFGRQLLAQG